MMMDTDQRGNMEVDERELGLVRVSSASIGTNGSGGLDFLGDEADNVQAQW